MTEYTVGQVNSYIKNMIATDPFLGNIYVKGEASNVKYHSSGHIYFSIKDETGAVACVMFRGNAMTGLGFRMENGQQIIAHGSINVYERDGRYQLYVQDIRLAGTGSLYEEYERLKQKLYDLGVFDFEIKKEIPRYPKRVGIVTAATGAAIQDIRNIARRRNPYVQLILYPALVQGDGAAKDIARGIETLDSMNVDTIIIGRGGGSIEDLWAFNEEIVAMAIFHARTPIISGTGHETDNTIADYAADKRAPTPSAACELAIPDVMTTVRRFEDAERSINRLMNFKVSQAFARLDSAEEKLRILNPKQKLIDHSIYVDNLADRIGRAMNMSLDRHKNKLQVLASRINGHSPSAKLVGGFGYVECDGEPVKGAEAVNSGDRIRITMSDGSFEAEVM